MLDRVVEELALGGGNAEFGVRNAELQPFGSSQLPGASGQEPVASNRTKAHQLAVKHQGGTARRRSHHPLAPALTFEQASELHAGKMRGRHRHVEALVLAALIVAKLKGH